MGKKLTEEEKKKKEELRKIEREKNRLIKLEKKKVQKKFGQFYTTNYDYILDGFTIPDNSNIIEPFVGQGDLLNWIGSKPVEKYDIDPKIECIHQDTLLTPPSVCVVVSSLFDVTLINFSTNSTSGHKTGSLDLSFNSKSCSPG